MRVYERYFEHSSGCSPRRSEHCWTGGRFPHADVEHAIESGLGIATLAKPVEFGEMGGADTTVSAHVAVLILVTEPHAQTEMLTQLIGVFQLDGWHDRLSAATTPEQLAENFAELLTSAGQQ